MIPSFLLALREGLEAALIIGIVLGVLRKINRPELIPAVWRGTAAAVLMSLIAALALNMAGAKFEGVAEEAFEGVAMLLAAAVLTWVIIWMRRQGRTMTKDIESRATAAAGGSGKALFALAFLAVFREGIELALFLLAARFASSPMQTLLGTLLGLAGAVALGWLLFAASYRFSLQRFFQITNILLILFAAGLVGLGVHELNEAGWIPSVIEHVWDINYILSDKSESGEILKVILGYNGNPSLTEVIAYIGYYVFLLVIFWRKPQSQEISAGQPVV
jgi:high-affinity iron transporter